MKTILCNHSITLERNERIEIGHFRIATNQKNLEKSGNWKSIKRNKGIVWEFIKKMVKSGKCQGIWKHAVVNVSMQIYSGLTSISFLTLLQIILICLWRCCHCSNHYLKFLGSNDILFIADISKRDMAIKKIFLD